MNFTAQALFAGVAQSMTVTFDGTPYYKPSGTWNFNLGTVVVPSFGSGFSTGVGTPFTMTGDLFALNAQGQPALNLSLTGQGTAGVGFAIGTPGGAAFITGINFQFTDGSASPVIPEPSTVLLLASGLAGIGPVAAECLCGIARKNHRTSEVRMYVLFTLALTALMLMSAPAWAVNIQVTDGFAAQSPGHDTGQFDFIGADFRFRGGTDPITAGAFGGFTDGFVGGTVVVNNAPWGAGAFNPLTYQDTTIIRTDSRLFFTASPATIMQTTPHQASATSPFTMAGTVTTLSSTGVALDTFNLTGQGTMNLSYALFNFNPTFAQLSGIRFDFGSPNGTPVVPEPTSVLLVASGLAGLGLWRRHSMQA